MILEIVLEIVAALLAKADELYVIPLDIEVCLSHFEEIFVQLILDQFDLLAQGIFFRQMLQINCKLGCALIDFVVDVSLLILLQFFKA